MRECTGFEQLTVGAAASGLTASVFGKANMAEITSQDTDDLRYRLDGTAATAAVGALWSGQGAEVFSDALIIKGNLRDVSLIRDASADVAIDVHYYLET